MENNITQGICIYIPGHGQNHEVHQTHEDQLNHQYRHIETYKSTCENRDG